MPCCAAPGFSARWVGPAAPFNLDRPAAEKRNTEETVNEPSSLTDPLSAHQHYRKRIMPHPFLGTSVTDSPKHSALRIRDTTSAKPLQTHQQPSYLSQDLLIECL